MRSKIDQFPKHNNIIKDIVFDYKPIKLSRKVIAIKFFISPKEQEKTVPLKW